MPTLCKSFSSSNIERTELKTITHSIRGAGLKTPLLFMFSGSIGHLGEGVMEGYKDDLLILAKRCAAEFITTSRVVTSRPCFVFGAIITPTDSDLVSQIILRNGETVLSEILISFKARYSYPLHYACPPVHFNKGLYVELTTNADGLTLQYLEE